METVIEPLFYQSMMKVSNGLGLPAIDTNCSITGMAQHKLLNDYIDAFTDSLAT